MGESGEASGEGGQEVLWGGVGPLREVDVYMYVLVWEYGLGVGCVYAWQVPAYYGDYGGGRYRAEKHFTKNIEQ